MLGIPDFRLFADPYISFQDEYQKASVLEDAARRLSFEDLLRFYWEITPESPRSAAERYTRYALTGEDRANACLAELDNTVKSRWAGQAGLEIGCGTGGLLVAAQPRFRQLVGTDIALRWLVVARKRLAGDFANVTIVCCCAEYLPFPDETFDRVMGVHVLEHSSDPQAVFSETARTLKQDGLCFFSTPNRFSLGPEPCIRVWGVGFLPRSLAKGYVKRIAGITYRHIRLLSFFELHRIVSRARFREWTISAAHIGEPDQRNASVRLRRLISIYHIGLRLPFLRFLLKIVGPFLQVIGRK